MTDLAGALWAFDRTGGQERPEVLEDDDTACPPFTEDDCYECGEPLRLLVLDPCPRGCCDRPYCLDCAHSLGIPYD